MFIRFFRSSFPIQYLVIGLIGFMLWGKSFIQPPPIPMPEGPVPLYNLLYSILSNLPHLAVITGFVLVALETWWLNILLNNNELVLKNSSLASLIFIIMMSSSPVYLTVHPLNISILISIAILNNLMRSYNRTDSLDLIYGAGFYTAIGSLFYFPFLLMLAIVPISFFLFRSGRWREWAAALIGFITPFIFLSVYFFVTDQLSDQVVLYEKMVASFFFYPIHLHTDDWIIGIASIVLAAWGLYYLLRGPMEKTVEIRAKTYLIVWLLAISLLSVAYSTTLLVYHLVMLFPTLTLLLTSAFLGIKKKRWAEIIFLIYFLLILINSYFYNPE
ncbi:MAG: hypothetical protein NTX43_04765 [Bacteroidetes bacterium]|nr:hypothetical protein [Bacteroidota bacterium]